MPRSGRRSFWISALGWVAVASLLFAPQAAAVLQTDGDAAPLIGDIGEVFNLAWNLSHGRGYRLDWDDPGCRAVWVAHDFNQQMRFFIERHGSHASLLRPPLMPLAMAAMLAFHPARPFLTWRLIDAALFGAAGALLLHGTLHRFGWRAALALLPLMLLDPLRLEYIPGLWTEGLAFDLLAVLVWFALADDLNGWGWTLLAGTALGLLCLDRSIFVPVLPLMVGVLAWSMRRRWRSAMLLLLLAVAWQAPWWARNMIVSHRFLPLGTQGGFNLPDEYSDLALHTRGLWNGAEMERLWQATAITPAQRAERSSPKEVALWPDQPLWAQLLYAVNCESMQTEIAVADLGQHAAVAWIRTHPARLPALFVEKIITLTIAHRGWLATLALLASGTLLADTARRRAAGRVALLVAVYAIGIGLTHVVAGRFLVPILPPLYVLAAAGPGEAIRRVSLLR